MLSGIALPQTTVDSSNRVVRISGRLVSGDGRLVNSSVRVERIDPDGFKDERSVETDRDGRFTFIAPLDRKYRFSLGSGIRTPPKRVDTSSGHDTDLGDMVFEPCSSLDYEQAAKASTKPDPVDDLKPE